MSEQLWFLTCIANPCRALSRLNLYRQFVDHILNDVKGNLLTVECAFDDEPYEIQPNDSDTYKVVQVRSKSRLWSKESQLNIGLRHLASAGAQIICWCDADIVFDKGEDIKQAITDSLEEYDVVQCFSTALDLGPSGEIMKIHHSLGLSHVLNVPSNLSNSEETWWHSGYVYAAKTATLQQIGGFFDVGIVGSGDRVMANSFIGKAQECCSEAFSEDYRKAIMEWQDKALAALPRGLGYCQAIIRHNFHGYKKDRGYNTRPQILKTHEYSPYQDVRQNSDGVLEFTGNKPQLEQAVLDYFFSRNEDVALRISAQSAVQTCLG